MQETFYLNTEKEAGRKVFDAENTRRVVVLFLKMRNTFEIYLRNTYEKYGSGRFEKYV